jgi:hypothetical protein
MEPFSPCSPSTVYHPEQLILYAGLSLLSMPSSVHLTIMQGRSLKFV